MKKSILLLIASAVCGFSQYSSFTSQTASTNLSGAMDGKPNFQTGTSDPATCTAGKDLFFNTSSLVWKVCTATNTWTTMMIGVTLTGTPSSGQVPTATSGTAATWQTPTGGSGCTSIGSADDYVIPGAPGPYGINSYLDVSQSHLTLGGNGVTVLSKVYMPCAFTPGVMSFVITTAGSAGCHFSIGMYDSTKTRVIYSGILTDSTSTADCDSTGRKTLTAGTTPAATGLGTLYPAGWYYVAATSDSAGATIVLKGLPMSSEDSDALLSVAPNAMGTLSGGQTTTGGALNTSFTTGSGFTSITSSGTYYLIFGH